MIPAGSNKGPSQDWRNRRAAANREGFHRRTRVVSVAEECANFNPVAAKHGSEQ